MSIAIIVHGGAGNIPDARLEAAQAGCYAAALLGWQLLKAGKPALEVVEMAARVLENNPLFNAGTGAVPNAAGNIELDAGIMEGHTLNVGAVASIELIKNPIGLARKVLDSPHVLLVGKGAEHFAHEQGIPSCTFAELLTEQHYELWKRTFHPELVAQDPEEKPHGTIGAVAIDAEGHLAAATSTGGFFKKYPGRVGDSPLVGCGFYADENAAVSCTGHGEEFVRLLIAKRAADCVAHGENARAAAEQTIAVLAAKTQGEGGLIVVDRLGQVGFAWNTSHMSYAYVIEGMDEPKTGV